MEGWASLVIAPVGEVVDTTSLIGIADLVSVGCEITEVVGVVNEDADVGGKFDFNT
jgi:hypothetical protein